MARYVEVPPSQIPGAIAKLKRRLDDIRSLPAPSNPHEIGLRAEAICTRSNETYREIFGPDSLQAAEAEVSAASFYVMFSPASWHIRLKAFEDKRKVVVGRLETTIALLEDKLAEAAVSAESSGARALRAYAEMDVHRAVEDAAGQLYRDGHYANAIEDAVKALNNLVRLRSALDSDGEALMNTAFSPGRPILRFNDLQDESDRNEQRGFMMMFAGAVAGLRNPRAHKLIKDDPERALEFIAFVSLLAKLLDGAKKAPRTP